LWSGVCHHIKREASRFIHLRAGLAAEMASRFARHPVATQAR